MFKVNSSQRHVPDPCLPSLWVKDFIGYHSLSPQGEMTTPGNMVGLEGRLQPTNSGPCLLLASSLIFYMNILYKYSLPQLQ